MESRMMGNYHARFGGREGRVLIEVRPSRPNAEIGNCMVCASPGLTPDFDQSAAPIRRGVDGLRLQ